MRKLLLVFLFCTCFIYANAQKSNLADSLTFLTSKFQYQKAIDLINNSKQANDKEFMFVKANAYRNLYKYSDAVKVYIQILQNDSSSIRTMAEMAGTFKLATDFQNALKYYELASSIDSSNFLFKIEQANCKFSLENYKAAKDDYKRLITIDSSNIFLLKRLANCYSKIQKDDSAIFIYKKVIKYAPGDANSVVNLCNLLASAKKPKESIGYSEDYLKLDSNEPIVRRFNSYYYLLDKQFDMAIQKFDNCLSKKDSSAFVLKNLGISYFKKESYDTAKTWLEKAFLVDSTDATTAHFLGIACFRSYYKELGIKYLEKTIDLMMPSPESLSILYSNLGEAYRGWDKSPCEKSMQAYKKAWEYNPKDTLALMYVGLGYDYCLHDSHNAIIYYTLFMQTRPPRKTAPPKDTKILTLSYYDEVEKRLNILLGKK